MNAAEAVEVGVGWGGGGACLFPDKKHVEHARRQHIGDGSGCLV